MILFECACRAYACTVRNRCPVFVFFTRLNSNDNDKRNLKISVTFVGERSSWSSTAWCQRY